MTETVFICSCCNRSLIPEQSIASLQEKVEGQGCTVKIIPDLCQTLQDGDETTIKQLEGATVAACHERAVQSLLAWRGVKASKLINLRSESGNRGPGNDAWFPVIDKDRCTECRKCHDYCPFGVYEMANGQVNVVHPQQCKNNCPSCARNCPQGAIIFPKYEHSPINGGVQQQEQAIRVDHSTLYADALRARLAERRASGISLTTHTNDNNQ